MLEVFMSTLSMLMALPLMYSSGTKRFRVASTFGRTSMGSSFVNHGSHWPGFHGRQGLTRLFCDSGGLFRRKTETFQHLTQLGFCLIQTLWIYFIFRD